MPRAFLLVLGVIMKQFSLSDRPTQPKSLQPVWIALGVGLPIISLLLILTQIDLRSSFETLGNQLFNPLAAPYRYRHFDTLRNIGSPIALVEQEIANNQIHVRQDPSSGLNLAFLAIAYLQMARATGEASWYLLAEQNAKQSLVSLPFSNPDAILVMARVAEARHDFPAALRLADQVPDHKDTIAIHVTANLAMGKLELASQAADALVDRTPSISSLTLQALVMAAQGQDTLALQSFQAALASEEAGETGSSARTRTLLGRFYYERGELELADALYREALRILPGYPIALINLAQLEIRRGEYQAADRHYAQVAASSRGTPRTFDPMVLRGRARIKQLQGDLTAAAELWSQAEVLLRQTIATNRSNGINASAFGHGRELARLLLERGRDRDVSEAVALMKTQVSLRRDAETLEIYAWALARSGDWQAAQSIIQEAIALGTRDASIFDRASVIEQALDNASQATHYFQQVQQVDPQFGDPARRALGLGAGLGS
jgi:tetratricopeptide (TPR) repeat protein